MADELTTQVRAALRKHAIETGMMYDFGLECIPLDDVAARVAAAVEAYGEAWRNAWPKDAADDAFLRALRGEL